MLRKQAYALMQDIRRQSISAGKLQWSNLQAFVTTPSCDAFEAITFENGEIIAIRLASGEEIRRGAVVRVRSSYAGNGIGVVIAFHPLEERLLPVQVSLGGARGEGHACISLRELQLLPTQSESNWNAVLALQSEPPTQ